ncbi:MAG: 3'-5' exonuclease [Bacteroidales bacterium]|nr:3'-5' exonuclease [Bacteroidales bacterium]
MKLNLRNPLAFIDLETTGIDVAKDRIVEICIIKVNVDNSEEVKTIRVNPTVPIPLETSLIHGIYDEDIKDAPTFKDIAKELAQFLEGADFAGFNSNRFDFPLLAEEFLRADCDFDFKKRKFVDVQTIFHKMEQRTLVAAYKFYCNAELENAHSALADTRATYEVLKAQVDRYENAEFKDKDGKVSTPVKNDINSLAEFSAHNNNVDFAGRIVYNEKGEETFNFGKYKGQTVESVFAKDQGYYGWMINNDFPLYTKKVLTNIKLRALNNKLF